jgi:hypothetical protein
MQVDYSIELGKDDPALELPWRSEDGAVRYYDLKADPSLVEQIPETSGCPELADFLTRINVPGFPLQTAKCDVWQTRDLSPEEQIFNAEWKFASYVDVVFAAKGAGSKHLGRAERGLADRRTEARRSEDLCSEALGSEALRSENLGSEAPSLEDIISEDIRSEDFGSEAFSSEDITSEDIRSEDLRSEVPPDSRVAGKPRDSDDDNPGSPDDQNPRYSFEAHESLVKGLCTLLARVPEMPASAEFVVRRCYFHTVASIEKSFVGFCVTGYVFGFGESSSQARLRWAIAVKLVQHALVQWANL